MSNLLNDELENLAHTLVDIKTLQECNKATIERAVELQERIGSRIKMLEERLDRLTKEAYARETA